MNIQSSKESKEIYRLKDFLFLDVFSLFHTVLLNNTELKLFGRQRESNSGLLA